MYRKNQIQQYQALMPQFSAHFQAADRKIWRAFSIRSCSIFKQERAPVPVSAIIRGSGFFIAAHIIFYAVIKYESVPLHPYPLSFVAADFLYKKRAEFFAPLFAFFITFLFLRVPAAPVHTVRSPPQTSEARPQRVLHDYP